MARSAVKIAALWAESRDGAIGKRGAVPWRSPADLRAVRSRTDGKILLVGSTTYAGLPPLPNRYPIVLSRGTIALRGPGEVSGSVREAVERAEALVHSGSYPEEVIVFGGALVYRETLPLVGRIYRTRMVDLEVPEADAYAPTLREGEWRTVSIETVREDRNGRVEFSVLDRLPVPSQ